MPVQVKAFLKRNLPEGSTVGWIIRCLVCHPLAFPLIFLRSWIASWRLTKRRWPIQVRLGCRQRLAIFRHPTATVLLNGALIFDEWGGVVDTSSIAIGENAMMEVKGEFTIGPGTNISVSKGGQLVVGGAGKGSASGITCRSRIMVEQDVRIGKDVIIAWGCFISDSDWHTIEGRLRCVPVLIGDHVWISHDVSVIKGAIIPDGCIVAPKSIVVRRQFPPHSLLAGQPAIVKRNDVHWHR